MSFLKFEDPHPDVPGRRETAELLKLMTHHGKTVLAPRWHRGVAYWYARSKKGGSYTHIQALEIALMPETSAVEVEIVEV